MKSKLFLISIFTIISSISLTLPTFAIESESDNKKFWTIPELVELREEDVMERDSLCEEDLECERERHLELLGRGGKYSALNGFSNMILLITSINPSDSTIRVLFHDENPIMRRMGETEPAILDEIFIAWFSREPIMFNNYYARNSHYNMEMYFLFSGDASTNGYGWFTPNQEIELRIDHAEALLKSPHLIFFTMEGERTSVSGTHDYSNCIESPLFEEGMECRMIFDDSGNFDFLPFWPGSNSPVYNPYSVEEGYGEAMTGGNTGIESNNNSGETTENDEDLSIAGETTDSRYPSEGDFSTIVSTLNAPDTAIPTKEEWIDTPIKSMTAFKRKDDESCIWCLILTLSLSGVFIFWWFLPVSKRRKNKEN